MYTTVIHLASYVGLYSVCKRLLCKFSSVALRKVFVIKPKYWPISSVFVISSFSISIIYDNILQNINSYKSTISQSNNGFTLFYRVRNIRTADMSALTEENLI